VGYASNSSKLVHHLSQENADVALLIGDLSYAQGFAADWDIFGQMFQPAFTRWPLMVRVCEWGLSWQAMLLAAACHSCRLSQTDF
jgi:hypothetical protein